MRLNLLPSYFKFIGLALIFACIISQIIFNLQNVEILHTWRMKLFELSLIIGSLLILISKIKSEDEFSEALRHQSIAVGFAFSIFMYLVNESRILTVFTLSYYKTSADIFITQVLLIQLVCFICSGIIW